jgi:hypothetical protein
MLTNHWLKRLGLRLPLAGGTPGLRKRRGSQPCRPSVEQLEGRELFAANLTITPITWNVIGLDSNKTSTGPDTFLVGARVANTGDATATNVVTNLVWDSTNTFY